MKTLQDDIACRGAIGKTICWQSRFLQGGHRPRAKACSYIQHSKHSNLSLHSDEGKNYGTNGNDGEGRDGKSD